MIPRVQRRSARFESQFPRARRRLVRRAAGQKRSH
jgi:hypothetical protein